MCCHKYIHRHPSAFISPIFWFLQEKAAAVDDLKPLSKPSGWNEDIDFVEPEVQKPTKPKGRKGKKKEVASSGKDQKKTQEETEEVPTSSKGPIKRRKKKTEKTEEVGEDKKEEEGKRPRKRKAKEDEEGSEKKPADTAEADKQKVAKVSKKTARPRMEAVRRRRLGSLRQLGMGRNAKKIRSEMLRQQVLRKERKAASPSAG